MWMITVVSVSMAVQSVYLYSSRHENTGSVCLSGKALELRCMWALGGLSGSRVHRVIRAQWCLSLQGNTPRFSW